MWALETFTSSYGGIINLIMMMMMFAVVAMKSIVVRRAVLLPPCLPWHTCTGWHKEYDETKRPKRHHHPTPQYASL